MRTAVLIPAWQAHDTIAAVVEALARYWPAVEGRAGVIVVDDGSTDGTAERAQEAGALVVRHGRQQGRGAALRTGLRVAHDLELDAVISVDADGEQPAEEAKRIAEYPCDGRALVLGVRDLRGMGAPRASRLSNRISNFLLSVCTGRVLADAQCALRRYPVRETLALDPRDSGYGFDAEVLLLAVRAGLPVVEVPVQTASAARPPHYRTMTDPARIMARVIYTMGRRQPGLIRRAEANPFGDGFAARP
jgi:glycosyltransferase involved in cell wall biosynthesis